MTLPKSEKLNVLVLYSWEQDTHQRSHAKEWVRAFCAELVDCDPNLIVKSDTLFYPKSDFKKQLRKKIDSADRIITIVTESYNTKIANKIGVAAWEEDIYRKKIESERELHNILFIKKEENVELPRDWDGFISYDLSWINVRDYNIDKTASDIRIKKQFEEIVRFLHGTPQYSLQQPAQTNEETVESQKTERFCQLFSLERKSETKISVNDLIGFIEKNKNQGSFVMKYLLAGPSNKSNLGGYMTPEVFEEFFLVKNPSGSDRNYNKKILELFKDNNHNALCVQSDRGSGKSVFVNTLYLKDEINSNHYKYLPCFIDFESISDLGVNKDSILEQKVKNLYKSMVVGKSDETTEEENFRNVWQDRFNRFLSRLTTISFPADYYNYFTLQQLKAGISDAAEKLSEGSAGYDEWTKSYSIRIVELRNKLSEKGNEYDSLKDLYFVILLVVLIALFYSRPQDNEKYIIVFDNLETFDAGNRTDKMGQFTVMCNNVLTRIFDELGAGDTFNLNFTFVIVLRTSTTILFGDIAFDLFDGKRYIIDLEHFDFEIEAMLKKLKFLDQYVPNAKDSVLYKHVHKILNILISQRQIDNYINLKEKENSENDESNVQLTFFARRQFFPLFNNDYRTATRRLISAFNDESTSTTISELLDAAKDQNEPMYNYLINGARMALAYYIFCDFQNDGILNNIGFPELHGNDNHSMTRMILAYLYWDFQKHLFSGKKRKNYKGVKLSKLISTFKYFCDAEVLSEILFNLSIYTRENFNKQDALRAWGNLLVFDDTEEKLTIEGLRESINKYISENTSKHDERWKNITVRLSMAGECFTESFVRNYEFLSARYSEQDEKLALFAIKDKDTSIEKISHMYLVIKNCIDKLLLSCEISCKLYRGTNENFECIMNKDNPNIQLFSCSLFLRFQECMDLIRETIDYIDRYRIVRYQYDKNDAFNEVLTKELTGFYNLYEYALDKLQEMEGNTEKIAQFIENWRYPGNQVFIINDNRASYGKSRPIQAYYARGDENFEKALDDVRQNPTNRVYDSIMEMSKPSEFN